MVGLRQGKESAREPLERPVVPCSSVDGFSSKPRAQLTFSSWNKVKAFGKLDATNLAQVHHSFVRARREPLDDGADPRTVFSQCDPDVKLDMFL